MNIPCKICEKRRARRHCPGVSGEICAQCCGTERENTIDCPLDCEYLREARQYERPAPLTAADVPNRDIRISEEFVREHELEVVWLASALQNAMEQDRVVDLDAHEALDALIRTYRTLASGLIYETRPPNPYAASILEKLKESIEALSKRMEEATGMHKLRDADVLGTLVFLQHLELQNSNGRRRGRAFFDFLRTNFGVKAASGLEP